MELDTIQAGGGYGSPGGGFPPGYGGPPAGAPPGAPGGFGPPPGGGFGAPPPGGGFGAPPPGGGFGPPGGFGAPPGGGFGPPPPIDAVQKVTAPAIGLLITAILGMLGDIAGLALNILGAGFATVLPADEGGGVGGIMSGTMGIVTEAIGLVTGIVILLGALKMKRLESHGFAMAAAILAALPCISPCCLLGMPIGIWAIMVLLDPGVKAAFQSGGAV